MRQLRPAVAVGEELVEEVGAEHAFAAAIPDERHVGNAAVSHPRSSILAGFVPANLDSCRS